MSKLKVLLDECIDRRLAKEITGCYVKTVPQMGWAGITNGMLLNKAQNNFDIFLTNDQNLSSQQNLTKYDIAVVVLCPPSNRFADLQKTLKKAMKKFNAFKSGYATFIR